MPSSMHRIGGGRNILGEEYAAHPPNRAISDRVERAAAAALIQAKYNIQERETERNKRVVEVPLDSVMGNRVLVQGAQEGWGRGEADYLKSVSEKAQTLTVTSIKRNGIDMQHQRTLMLLIGIAVLPELLFVKRLVFLVALIAVIALITLLHKVFVAGTIIHFNEDRPSFWKRYSADVTSLAITTASGLAAVIFGALSGNLLVASGRIRFLLAGNQLHTRRQCSSLSCTRATLRHETFATKQDWRYRETGGIIGPCLA